MPWGEAMPRAWGKERLAPLVPVWSQPLYKVSAVQGIHSRMGKWGNVLDCGSDGAYYNREVQRAGLAPLAQRLVADGLFFIFV